MVAKLGREEFMNASAVSPRVVPRNPDRLLGKWALEERTSLDITTIYRKMKAGTFPQPVRVGRRRVAWRESDVAAWLRACQDTTVGTGSVAAGRMV